MSCGAWRTRHESWPRRSPSGSDDSTSRPRSTTSAVVSARTTRSSDSATRSLHRCRVEIAGGAAIGWCTLDWRYEGPFTYAHGGVSALLLDQIMGYAAAAAGHPGVTGRLEVRYRATVPLGQPLRLQAGLIDVLGVRAAVRGSISLAAAPDDALVEAEGRFLALRPEQAARLFGSVADHTR